MSEKVSLKEVNEAIELHLAFRRSGMTPHEVQRIIDDSAVRVNIIEFIRTDTATTFDPSIGVGRLGLTARTEGVLKKHHLTTAGLISLHTSESLQSIPGIGSQAHISIERALAHEGGSLRTEDETVLDRLTKQGMDAVDLPLPLLMLASPRGGDSILKSQAEASLKLLHVAYPSTRQLLDAVSGRQLSISRQQFPGERLKVVNAALESLNLPLLPVP